MSEQQITTIESALKWAKRVLSDSESGLRDARLLLGEVMGVDPTFLMRYPDRALTVEQTALFNRWVAERAIGTPIAYLLGRKGFYDIEVTVTPDVLIPRPETELLVEQALEITQGRHCFIVDVGTGSGIIALTMAKHRPHCHITGIDISEAALAVAQENAQHLGLDKRVRWIQGDLLQPLIERREHADVLLANLPYIRADELPHLDVARFEPDLALNGGDDGLALIRRLLEQAPSVMREGGFILMEIGADQGAAVTGLAGAAFPDASVRLLPDLAGHDRVVIVSLSQAR